MGVPEHLLGMPFSFLSSKFNVFDFSFFRPARERVGTLPLLLMEL